MHYHGRHLRFSPWPIAMVLCAIAMAVGVFVVTQGVQQREARVAEMNRKLLSEQQTLRVLDAEWAYLTRPQRLETLMAIKAERDVMPPVPAPIATLMTEPQKVEPSAGIAEKPVAPVKKKIAAKETKQPVKKVAAKKKAPAPDVWPIARKTQSAKVSSAPIRAGVARPILE